jgi:hypothetical protein
MAGPDFSIVFSAPVSGTSDTGSAGSVVLPSSTDGQYVIATSANRGTRRATGVALDTFVAKGVVKFQQFGQIDPAVTGLGTGAASWVRCSATGLLERCTPSGADDVVGWCETDGTLHASFGFLTAAIVNGGGGGGFTPPTGTGFVTVSSGALDGAALAYPAGGPAGVTAMNAGDAASVATAGTNASSAITAERTATATLTGKTIDAASNTLSNLTQSSSKAAVAVAALAIDWNAGNVFTKTLGAGSNTFTFANAASGKVITVRFTGAASTVTWPTVKWAGGAAPTQTASGTDVYTFVHDGTSIYGSVVQAMA